MRAAVAEACAEFLRAEDASFTAWCALSGRRGTPDPAAVIASQDPVHRAAEELRRLCLADPLSGGGAALPVSAPQHAGENPDATETRGTPAVRGNICASKD
jgi:hypothetical protein